MQPHSQHVGAQSESQAKRGGYPEPPMDAQVQIQNRSMRTPEYSRPIDPCAIHPANYGSGCE